MNKIIQNVKKKYSLIIQLTNCFQELLIIFCQYYYAKTIFLAFFIQLIFFKFQPHPYLVSPNFIHPSFFNKLASFQIENYLTFSWRFLCVFPSSSDCRLIISWYFWHSSSSEFSRNLCASSCSVRSFIARHTRIPCIISKFAVSRSTALCKASAFSASISSRVRARIASWVARSITSGRCDNTKTLIHQNQNSIFFRLQKSFAIQ